MEKIFKDNHDGTLNVSVSYARADYQPVLTKVMNKLLENVTVKGFRKGKAPMHFIEKVYGESVFFEDALNILYPVAVNEAITESKLEFVDDKIDFAK